VGTANPAGNSSPPEPQGPAAERFGSFLLFDRIAAGGMAEVFIASPLHAVGRMVALKRMLPALAQDEHHVTMFLDEARLTARLDHPNLVTVYDYGRHGGTFYISMELVLGRDLEQVIRRMRRTGHRLPPSLVAHIGAELCKGLDHAHRVRGPGGEPLHVVHRDVSPQNILLSYDGQVKLADFGVARSAVRQTQTQAGVIKGKLRYMSPEQVRDAEVDARSDLFALGTCLYEMLTGVCPFEEPDAVRTLQRVREARVQPPSALDPAVPEELSRLVLWALSRDPGMRPGSAAELGDALSAHVRGQGLELDAAALGSWMQWTFADVMQRDAARMQSYRAAHESEWTVPGTLGRSTVDADGHRASDPEPRLTTGSFRASDGQPASPRAARPGARRRSPWRRRRHRRGRTGLALVAAVVLAVGAVAHAAWSWLDVRSAASVVRVQTVPDRRLPLWVDGVRRGRTPNALEGLTAGMHTVTVRGPGGDERSRRIDVGPSSTTIVVLEAPTAAGDRADRLNVSTVP
jgi:serine/threonine protein kinase